MGTLILLAVIALSAPLTLPRLFGYEIFHVVSGSMEPAISVGSAVYVKAADPLSLEPGEIIVFSEGGIPVTHRVLENHKIAHELETKGDANEIADFAPVPYDAVIGRVTYQIPLLGAAMELLSGAVAKAYLLCLALCGAMLNILGARIREHGREPAAVTEADAAPKEKEKDGRKRKRDRRAGFRRALMALALLVFALSAAGVIFVRQQYRASEQLYESAAERFTAPAPAAAASSPQREEPLKAPDGESAPEAPEEGAENAEDAEDAACAPIRVDFEALRAINPDVIGWICCPDTPINYPVLLGATNNSYLFRGYDRRENVSGSIFADASNSRDLSDRDTILYGHHMGDGSMFASLELWQEQRWFDAHPVMWLLTPEQDYQIVLYSAYTVSAYDEIYTIRRANDPGFEDWLARSTALSAVMSEHEPDPEANYVMLSTCAYVFRDARAVVHGELRPVGRKP